MVEGALVDGISLSVLELIGRPGETVLMHPWQLHAPAPNRGLTPRLILGDLVMRTGKWIS
jgi:hypothetical protein